VIRAVVFAGGERDRPVAVQLEQLGPVHPAGPAEALQYLEAGGHRPAGAVAVHG
jgi:hypothetical protein